ncbi:hypothetical protein EIN_226240 [Entamoeba invadens IP1]|uniref:Thioredoxin domain-containing protein n=1 Tax=Entamoeba invadens IP1 TaxID=370355 RepID=A0A0A1U2F6_ENTIV|nr:hypothetical protein EIN_226240 [Entamoeba invadens IP1]ELP88261.1 hypothetical protein EIN_226240 [Entamoeba invadens IP1]|eukprot:XP_004255032.1 hypothetical protein EIN_226240 [Entamoeba invadens IP1]
MWAVFLLSLISSVYCYEEKWNSYMGEMRWHSFEGGLEEAKRRELPILAFFTADECEQCPVFFQFFNVNPRFRKLSKNFVLAALDSTDVYFTAEPFDKENYAPKFAFFDYNGKLLPFDSYESEEHKYFFGNLELLMNAMEDVDEYMFDVKSEL